ncbi:hypothetical protein [Paenibacillus cremeus]|uniref:Uncharacterized protein n=1 Tax=Paenibacillus cremeus TaxID=2163881 RepID=A0A559KCX8_9BACL|nr:hypothetical protein [Paenibacillus cremeus]TVY09973.1 hypothetical protein FPZ49_11420 [Paenibacillus cremeus]
MPAKIDFNIIYEGIINYTRKLGRIPTNAEIDQNDNLPSYRTIHTAFVKNQGQGYIPYLISKC